MTGFWDYLDRRVKGLEPGGPATIDDTVTAGEFYARNGMTPWFVNDKLEAYAFYRENGIPTPGILEVYDRVEDVDLARLPESFCIKPNLLHSSAGVLPLRRIAENLYFDRLRKRVIPDTTILRELAAAHEKSNLKPRFRILVEEALGHAKNDLLVPFDYKIYAFAEGPGLILQVDRNSDRSYFSFFDGDFAPIEARTVIDVSRPSISYFGTPAIPDHAVEMLDCARRIPGLLGTPFVSVDMYSTKDGFFLGEMTPTPGAPYYKAMFEFLPETDERLGAMWARGEAGAGR